MIKTIQCFVLFVLTFTASFAQKSLNEYKYVTVSTEYEFLTARDAKKLQVFTKSLFDDLNFKALVYNLDEALPQDLGSNPCLGLNAVILDESSLFKTKLKIELKDCVGNTVYLSEYGTSKHKSYHVAYREALGMAFGYLGEENYSYLGENSSNAIVVNEPKKQVKKTRVESIATVARVNNKAKVNKRAAIVNVENRARVARVKNRTKLNKVTAAEEAVKQAKELMRQAELAVEREKRVEVARVKQAKRMAKITKQAKAEKLIENKKLSKIARKEKLERLENLAWLAKAKEKNKADRIASATKYAKQASFERLAARNDAARLAKIEAKNKAIRISNLAKLAKENGSKKLKELVEAARLAQIDAIDKAQEYAKTSKLVRVEEKNKANRLARAVMLANSEETDEVSELNNNIPVETVEQSKAVIVYSNVLTAKLIPDSTYSYSVKNSFGEDVYTLLFFGKENFFTVKGQDAMVYKANGNWVVAHYKDSGLQIRPIDLRF